MNLVSTSPRIQLPAITHAIVSTFSRDGVSESDIDRDICKFISDVIAKNRTNFKDVDYHNLGRGVGLSDDGINDSDDVWKGLTPNNK